MSTWDVVRKAVTDAEGHDAFVADGGRVAFQEICLQIDRLKARIAELEKKVKNYENDDREHIRDLIKELNQVTGR